MADWLSLRSGCNPHQTPARASVAAGQFPLTVRNGEPGFINLLDALGSWQLVCDLHAATDTVAAVSFKHVTPAGAAVAASLGEDDRRAGHLDPEQEWSLPAAAYARARGGDRLSSYGDWVAVSATVDRSLAGLLAGEVSDGIIAPAYEPDAVEVLAAKKHGRYGVLQIDPRWEPGPLEVRTVFGIRLEQPRNDAIPGPDHLVDHLTAPRELPATVCRDLVVALVAVKHAMSNAVAVCYHGQVIGLAAGQQSRIDATRLACDKADRWWLRRHPAVFDLPLRHGLSRTQRDNAVDAYLHDTTDTVGDLFTHTPTPLSRADRQRWLAQRPALTLASDGAIPFRDNIDRAAHSHIGWIAQTGGSARDPEVAAAADSHNIGMVATGLRLFTH